MKNTPRQELEEPKYTKSMQSIPTPIVKDSCHAAGAAGGPAQSAQGPT